MSEPNANVPPTPGQEGQQPSPTPTTETTQKPADDPAKKPEEGKKDDAPQALTADSIKIPEGLTVDEPSRDRFLGIMNDQSLDPAARAQALIELQADLAKAASEQGSKAWEDLNAKWIEESRADPVVGGDKLEPTLGAISKLIDKYAVNGEGKPDPEVASLFREAMDTSGLGNHRAVIRVLGSIAKELALEGSPVSAGQPGGAQRSAAEILYPNQGKS